MMFSFLFYPLWPYRALLEGAESGLSGMQRYFGLLSHNCFQVTVMLRGRGVILSRGALSSVGQFVSLVDSTVTDCEAMLAGLSKEHPAYYAYMRPSLLDMHTLLDQMARQVDFFAPLNFPTLLSLLSQC